MRQWLQSIWQENIIHYYIDKNSKHWKIIVVFNIELLTVVNRRFDSSRLSLLQPNFKPSYLKQVTGLGYAASKIQCEQNWENQ